MIDPNSALIPGATVALKNTETNVELSTMTNADGVYHLYVVRHAARDRLRAHLDGRRISTLIHYPFLLHRQPLFASGARSSLPIAEEVAGELLSLPLHPHLTEEETHAVIAAVLDFEKSRNL
ncbi:carboxypeptidase-like regulatory domain-containing protein [Pyrinomonas methylaliphatogenes]|uniref:Predicted PLP-dependent enzyme possibly involved in cell wall biogenesis n=1 Tax=Pyrinomonas methylaliphatogenes TaxID=454194 RepID=A0A0B6WUV3_9BACT|nr:carboxypeptidase-like regulatory domain-containing protein [Pyrinomonas methylaliphatogenes]CDM64851.1 predicted PLP-dependent enzyme possibly involved in cell wall biogenesis [Pyrinomonas methylaliphatogenes]